MVMVLAGAVVGTGSASDGGEAGAFGSSLVPAFLLFPGSGGRHSVAGAAVSLRDGGGLAKGEMQMRSYKPTRKMTNEDEDELMKKYHRSSSLLVSVVVAAMDWRW
ncbi:hypothetical protein GUJ93_ZPchr0006g44681 [Zizania palustris]|uniref:Uncharacterized protein n=1 Tax=Zizania palustris TaxID=103762 RepID=A0A8J5VJA3_ZIZPA|nr:hypothetical protein GUJ93_ZPchr0006g44681 [Zizania palustris]